ncbi:MAG: response regulator [Archangium sp.]
MRRLPLVLVVDDDPMIVRSYARVVSRDADVITAHSVPEARELLNTHRIDLLLTDFMMPGETGDVLLRLVAKEQPAARRVLMTAAARHMVEDLVHDGTAHQLVSKPARIEELLDLVKTVAR